MYKLLVMDVDGTLTNGRIYISSDGELLKAFDVKDGYGIKNILPKYGIEAAIITGRRSPIVERRAEELNIRHFYQGVEDKEKCLIELSKKLNVSFDCIACIGDDMNDLPMMRLCGISGCPADAVAKVRNDSDYVCAAPGGYGAVREFIEWLITK